MERNRYTLAPSVYIAGMGKDALLLDLAQLQKDRQYVLIKGGAPLFAAVLTGQERTNIVTSLVERHGFPKKTIEQSIDACFNAGWIVDNPTSSPSWPATKKLWRLHWLPLRIEAILLLQRIHVFIQRNAFWVLIQALMDLPAEKDWERDLRVQKIIQVVDEAAHIFREPMTCLHQSLAICWMLRMRGIAAHVAIRVQQDPLMGHMIVVHGEHVISWKPGLHSITTYAHFVAATTLLFHSGQLDLHYR